MKYVICRDNSDPKWPPYIIGPFDTANEAGMWAPKHLPAATYYVGVLIDPSAYNDG